MCEFFSHTGNDCVSVEKRFLKENHCEVLIRHNPLVTIYEKVEQQKSSL